MNFEEYKSVAGQCMLQAVFVYDLARSAEKITQHKDVQNKDEGPFLISPGGNPIENNGYMLRPSIEMNATINIHHTGDIHTSPKSNKMELDMIMLPEINGSRTTPFISKTSIIEQFELLKKYLVTIDAPFNKKGISRSRGIIDDSILDLLEKLASRRNDLTHEPFTTQETMRVAVEYFYSCLYVAKCFENGQAYPTESGA